MRFKQIVLLILTAVAVISFASKCGSQEGSRLYSTTNYGYLQSKITQQFVKSCTTLTCFYVCDVIETDDKVFTNVQKFTADNLLIWQKTFNFETIDIGVDFRDHILLQDKENLTLINSDDGNIRFSISFLVNGKHTPIIKGFLFDGTKIFVTNPQSTSVCLVGYFSNESECLYLPSSLLNDFAGQTVLYEYFHANKNQNDGEITLFKTNFKKGSVEWAFKFNIQDHNKGLSNTIRFIDTLDSEQISILNQYDSNKYMLAAFDVSSGKQKDQTLKIEGVQINDIKMLSIGSKLVFKGRLSQSFEGIGIINLETKNVKVYSFKNIKFDIINSLGCDECDKIIGWSNYHDLIIETSNDSLYSKSRTIFYPDQISLHPYYQEMKNTLTIRGDANLSLKAIKIDLAVMKTITIIGVNNASSLISSNVLTMNKNTIESDIIYYPNDILVSQNYSQRIEVPVQLACSISNEVSITHSLKFNDTNPHPDWILLDQENSVLIFDPVPYPDLKSYKFQIETRFEKEAVSIQRNVYFNIIEEEGKSEIIIKQHHVLTIIIYCIIGAIIAVSFYKNFKSQTHDYQEIWMAIFQIQMIIMLILLKTKFTESIKAFIANLNPFMFSFNQLGIAEISLFKRMTEGIENFDERFKLIGMICPISFVNLLSMMSIIAILLIIRALLNVFALSVWDEDERENRLNEGVLKWLIDLSYFTKLGMSMYFFFASSIIYELTTDSGILFQLFCITGLCLLVLPIGASYWAVKKIEK